jgi:integrase
MPRRRESHLPAAIARTKSGKYQARFEAADGSRPVKTFTNLRDAKAWLSLRRAEREKGESYFKPKAGKERFAQLWDEFLASRRPKEVTPTFDRDVSYGNSLILPHLGTYEIARLDAVVLQKWVNELAEAGKARATVEKALQLVMAALRFAVDHKKLPKAPERRLVNLPNVRHSSPARFLTLEELASLLSEFDAHYTPLVFTAAFTGLRWGELAGLKAKDVNLAEGHLTVNHALKEVNGNFHLGEPKWNSRRTIHLPADLVEVLRGSLAAIGDGNVFTSREGTLLRRSNFRRREWLPAVRKSVGIPMRFHDLRHTHAALLIANNENPKVIQERLGHKDISTTLNVYGHLMPGLGKDAADRLNGSFVKIRSQILATFDESNVVDLKRE